MTRELGGEAVRITISTLASRFRDASRTTPATLEWGGPDGISKNPARRANAPLTFRRGVPGSGPSPGARFRRGCGSASRKPRRWGRGRPAAHGGRDVRREVEAAHVDDEVELGAFGAVDELQVAVSSGKWSRRSMLFWSMARRGWDGSMRADAMVRKVPMAIPRNGDFSLVWIASGLPTNWAQSPVPRGWARC